ncbi:MAG: InlB B-repeat-containing protein [Paludibacteraceae bacterium]|nr:InlB B-repeat-containing protein [Paludibacteraceae bacterium]
MATLLLCLTLFVGSGNAWGAEGTTHDFSQSLSQLLNNNASISSINIASQSYTVKEVKVTYSYNNKLAADIVTISVSVGGTSFGSFKVVSTKTSGTTAGTQSFKTSPQTSVGGAITVSFTNHTGSGTGHGTFQVSNVQLVEGAAAGPCTVTFTKTDGSTQDITEASTGAGVTPPTMSETCDGWEFQGWSEDESDDDESTDELDLVTLTAGKYYPSSDVTLYPVYTKTVDGAPAETKTQTFQYDTWTYGGSSTNKSTYRLFHSGGYVESASTLDFSKLSKVIVYGGTYGGGSYNGISIRKADGSTVWKNATVSGSSQTAANNITGGTSLTGTAKLRVYSTSGTATGSGVRISKVEIFTLEPSSVTYYYSYPTCCSDPGLAYGTGSVTKTYGNSAFTNTLTNSHSVAVTYALSSVSPAGCVSINASTGQVTINGAGSATVTASSIAQTVSTVDYCADEASYTLTVNKANITPTLTYSPASVAVGDNSATPSVSGNTGSGTVTYAITSATPAGCATINTSTGVVTGVAIGTVTVTATIGATANYNGNTATATVNITAASNFINGETVFIQAESSSAWNDNACVKAWFNNSGAGGAAQTTYWLFDATGGDAGKKVYATIVPSTGTLNQVQLQRFASNCSTWWNSNGDLTKAASSGSNAFRSYGGAENNVAWNPGSVTLDLMGDPNSWASTLGTLTDQGNGVWSTTYNNYAPANAAGESQEFKLACNYNGWVATNNGENETLSGMHVGSTYNITATLDIKDHTLTMSKTYVKGTVHFNMNGHGSAIADLTNVTAGSKISAPSAPTETGWTFGGWYKEAGCTNEWNFGSDVVNETMTLYAKWTIKTTTLSFNQNGGTGGQTTTKTATYGSAMPTPITCPTRTGYDFGGYYESSGGTGTQYYTNAGASARTWNKENATWTLYAKWTAKEYSVTLDREGATTGSTSVTMTYNSSSHTAITAPSKDGYTFGGWWTGDEGTGTMVMDASGVLQANVAGYTGAGGIWTRTTTPTTLYAKWETCKQFTLATSSTTLVDGDEIVLMNTGSTYAMSTTQESNYRGYTNTGISVSGTTLSVYANSDAQIIFLEESGSYLLFNVGGYNYLYSTSASSGSLKTQDITQDEITGNSKWSYSIDASNNANIYSNGDNATYKYLQYNSGSPRFKCYSSDNQQKVKIYCHHITTPFVRYSPEALQTFQYAVGYGPSLAQALQIKGYNLTGNLTVTCPSGYELSTTPNASDFGTSNITLTRSSNKVNATIYIRLAAGKSVGSYDTNLAISGGGITTTNVPLVGLVTAADGTGEMYVALRDVSDLFPDDEMVLLNDTGTWIMNNTNLSGNNQRGSNTGFIYKGTTVYVTDGYSKVQKITTEESSVANRWLLKAGTKYIYAASASANQLKTAATKTTATSNHSGEWLIETNATGIATIHAPESSVRDTINFNYNGGGDYRLFSCYNRFLNRKHGGTSLYYRTIPNIWCQPSSLTGFSVDYGAGASAAQTFTVKGKNLGENTVTLTAPAGYEISKTSSSTGYATSLTLTPTNGKITSTTIWVRITAGNEAGTYNGDITATATGAATRTVTLEGVVNPVPEIILTASSDPLYVTSRNGISIMAVGHLTLSISGARAGQAVTISGTDLVFYKDNGTKYVNLSTTPLTAPLTNQVVYVFYSPSSDGTGAITSPDITVSCDGGSETFSGKIKVRNLPDKVAIVAKTGDTWMALPGSIPSATNPSSVLVSVADGKAYGTNAVAYKLWPVKTTNGTADRSGTATGYDPAAKVADRLRFTGYAGGNKGLWANNVSGTGTGYTRIRTVVVIDEISDDGSSGETPEEWKVVTTEVDGQFVYTLQTQQSNNTKYLRFYGSASGGPKWGTYADGTGINNLYILPLEEITEADITVMEWGTNKIAVSYPNRASCTAMTAKIGTNSPTAVTINSIGGDIYELTGVGDLQSNPAKTLILSATEGSAKQKILSIPYIITTNGVAEATIRTAIGSDVAKITDVVIRSGGKLTTGTTSGSFKDLYIYPGGKASVTKAFAVKHVYMRGGYSWLGGAYALPQLYATATISGTNSTNGGVFYDLCIDNSIYYMMALPKTVALADVTNEIGTKVFDAWIKEYSGEGRTLTPKSSGWSYISGDSIKRGKGYEIAIKPRVSGRPYGILRFPLLKNAKLTAETDCTPAVTGWGCNDGNVTDNNKGWNCIGNPFLTSYNNTATPGSAPDGLVQTKTLVHHPGDPWNGTWDWDESTVKYFTIPRYTEYEYDDVRAYPYKLDAFYPFFLQVTGDGTLSFTASNKALKAPSMYAKKTEREVFVDFAIKDIDGKKDEAGLTISNQYSEAFDMNDKEKTIQNGNSTLKVYTMVGDYRVAYNALPEAAAAQLIPVGYIAPAAGSYKFSRVDGADYSEVEHLWLTDYETNDVVDLLVEEFYAFESAAGQINNRFAINAVLKPEQDNTATGLEDQENDVAQPMKFIYQDKLYILRGGVIYDATGKRVREVNK